MVRSTMPTSIDERKSFHYTIENITEDKAIYNYWILKTFYVFLLLISTP